MEGCLPCPEGGPAPANSALNSFWTHLLGIVGTLVREVAQPDRLRYNFLHSMAEAIFISFFKPAIIGATAL